MSYYVERFLRAGKALLPTSIWGRVVIFGLGLLIGIARFGASEPLLKHWGLNWIVDLSGWAFVAAGFCILALILAWKVSGWQTMRLTCKDLRIVEDNGCWIVQVQILSEVGAQDVNSQIEKIECLDPVRDVHDIRTPVPIFSQERSIERNRGQSDEPARPHRYRQGETKWHEVFWINDDLLHINRPQAFVRRDWVRFHCSLFSPSAPPLVFSIVYYEHEDSKWSVILVDAHGRSTARKDGQSG